MRNVTCAAVDLGATSGRVIVGVWGPKLQLTEVHRFTNVFHSLGKHDYWDVARLWDEIRAGLRKAKAQFPKLASVGVDCWGVDYALVNDAGRLVYPTHAYRDVALGCEAMKVLRSRLYEAELQKQNEAIAKERKGQVGTGDRSEKIRTYNFPQSRVTDHRINFTTHQLQSVLDGNLDEIIGALTTYYTAEKLREVTETK